LGKEVEGYELKRLLGNKVGKFQGLKVGKNSIYIEISIVYRPWS